MWKFKPFMQKEPAGLEGRTLDVANLKLHVRNAIAEGGFSCVYLAKDALHASKQYALKHIICNDHESMELVVKEISVMKSLKGHPNVARGAAYFEEKQILTIFLDICNAVFAMHCQSPPVAHRDLKAENILLGSDGLWKLCDFGSTSTNHKRFERPEEWVWFRVNEQLPAAQQKSLPDQPPEMPSTEDVPRSTNRSPQMPSRSPPPPPHGEPAKNTQQPGSRPSGGQLGAFWSTQHAKDSVIAEEKLRPKYDEEPTGYTSVKYNRSPISGETVQTHSTSRNTPDKLHKPEAGPSKDIEINFFEDKNTTNAFQDEAFNTFVAEFDSDKISSGISNKKTGTEKHWRLK
ncbi:Serine/threonine-protein kinase [Hibiscus syriacus]|uniref:non-specific serine/threonine protein kinase n=1 Tax=Hibiscus syriacus TaxID=106335 RepID=A0A6A2YH30_HIBSY|nr:Serine/threonine-protein kinase [Hibiscus syriacus]